MTSEGVIYRVTRLVILIIGLWYIGITTGTGHVRHYLYCERREDYEWIQTDRGHMTVVEECSACGLTRPEPYWVS